MLFSRNPISGEMESYTDEGIYAGHVFTMGDFISNGKKANDGGPGSGNFGHSGRPGSVGGSGGEGGGKGHSELTGKMKEEGFIDIDDPDFDIFSLIGNTEESEEEKTARREKEQAEEREKKERERYGNNGLLEKDYPEDLRLSDKEEKEIADIFREYRDKEFKADSTADVVSALHGLTTEGMLDRKKQKLQEVIEGCTEELANFKKMGYSYKTHNPQALMTKEQKLEKWWNDVYETGFPENWAEKGPRYWQKLRKSALNDIGHIDLAKKIVKRNEFAKEQSGYMPWRKNPNRDDPSYKPWKSNDEMAEDGGPGSGNFGHKGRPGQVGGSGKGGGAQYRGGRSDIGYYNSRKDWLNGLSGEKQHEAIRNIAELKRSHKEKWDKKQKILNIAKRGLITPAEAEERIKREYLQNVEENMTPEEFAVKAGSAQESSYLLSQAKQARNWDKYKNRLVNENLSEDEKKIYEALEDKWDDRDAIFGMQDISQALIMKEQLEAKAMGLVDFDVEVPDEIQYRLGVKERPAPPEPPKPEGPNYDWYENRTGSQYGGNLEAYLAIAAGDTPGYGHKYTKEDFAELNQKFINKMAYESPSPNEVSYYGTMAVNAMRLAMSPTEKSKYGIVSHLPFEYTKEMADRLTDDEKRQLLTTVNNYYNHDAFVMKTFDKVEDITTDDYFKVEKQMQRENPRTKSGRKQIQDYILMQEKMLTGATPTSQETMAAKETEKAEAAKAAKAARDEQFKKEQAEFAGGQGKIRKLGCRMKVVGFDSKKIEAAKSPQEIDDSFNSGGFFNEGCNATADPAIPPVVYADSARAYQRVVERFPFLAGELGSFGGNTSGDATGACNKLAYSPTDREGEIRLNHKDFTDPENQTKLMRNSINRKWHAQVDEGVSGAESTMTHELGHALANWLHRVTIGSFVQNDKGGYDNEVADLLKERTFKALKMKPTYENIRDGLSEYGAASRKNRGKTKEGSVKVKVSTNSDEFFAEAFKEGMLSSNPRPIAKEFMRQLDLFIKENNITADTSALVETARPELLDKGKNRYTT